MEDTGKDKVLEAIKALEKREDVLYVGPDYYLEPCSDTSTQTYEAYFENQWAYDKIELGEAWDEIDTSSEILVGIMDSGIDGDHPDLEERIDSSLSCDFAYLYGNTDNVTNDLDDDPLEDDDNHNNHGTKVAGIIAGICDNAKLVSLKIMEGVTLSNGDGGGAKYRSSYACRAIEHAEQNNIKILCMSVGWAGSSASGEFDTDGYEPMNSVFDQYSGLLICAAGNHYRNIDDDDAEWDIYPQQYDDDLLLVVSASTDEDAIWYNPVTQKGSNVGEESVDLFAPGKDIATTVKGGGRGTMTGTSAAAPMVAGVAAMILSMYPDLSDDMIKIKEYIIDRADDSSDGVTAFSGKCVSGGRLNAFEAVKEAIDDNAPEEPETCLHESTYYLTDSLTHTLYCRGCGERVGTPRTHGLMRMNESDPTYHTVMCLTCGYSANEIHSASYNSIDSNRHLKYCTVCNYSGFENHDLYVQAVYDGDNGCDIACRDCSYSFHCDCNPEYGGGDSTGHYAACPDGYYSLFEAHNYGQYTDLENGNHSATCVDCGYVYTAQHLYFTEFETENLFSHNVECLLCEYDSIEAHTWISSGLEYECSVCGMTSDSIPGIMSLPDPELEAYLASLSDEELEEFIASLPEDQVDRVTALLPSDDEHLTE